MLSHRTAALLHRMQPVERGPVELIVPRGHSRGLADTRRHRPREFDPSQVSRIDGLPVTTPVRTLLDISGQLLVPRLAEVVEHCEVEGICPLVAVGAELARVRRRGLPGVRRLETVLDRLGPGEGLPHSELERLGDEVRHLAGLPEPVHEHPLPSAHGRTGFVDRAWLEAMLIVEYDGRRWHTRRAEIDRDHQRDLEASCAGLAPAPAHLGAAHARPGQHRRVVAFDLRAPPGAARRPGVPGTSAPTFRVSLERWDVEHSPSSSPTLE